MNEPPVICAAPGCENPVPTSTGRGRRPIYCSVSCRPTASQSRHRRIEVDVTHEPTPDGDRPTGRVWSVILRRGIRQVVIASELGRPSAESLAAQVNTLLTNDRPKGEEMLSTKI